MIACSQLFRQLVTENNSGRGIVKFLQRIWFKKLAAKVCNTRLFCREHPFSNAGSKTGFIADDHLACHIRRCNLDRPECCDSGYDIGIVFNRLLIPGRHILFHHGKPLLAITNKIIRQKRRYLFSAHDNVRGDINDLVDHILGRTICHGNRCNQHGRAHSHTKCSQETLSFSLPEMNPGYLELVKKGHATRKLVTPAHRQRKTLLCSRRR